MLAFLLDRSQSCVVLSFPVPAWVALLSHPSRLSLPTAQAPKCVKIFINLPRSMDFDDAERSEATQTLDLAEEDFKDDGLIPLRYVKFQNVQSVTVSHLTPTNHLQASHFLVLSFTLFFPEVT